MIRIGPYRFRRPDIDRTLRDYDELWQLYREGRDATSLDPLKAQLTGIADDDLPQAWESFLAAGRALRSAGQLPRRVEATVVQVSVSGGGVPKLPVEAIEVGFAGVHGDIQKSKKHHGAPWQALCIWSTEAIAQLNADGHQLTPGAAGENVTVEGLPWDEVRAGVRLRLGTVLCDVSAFALPCSQNARWFLRRDVFAMHHERGPSRVYATVLEPGRIATGDPAVLEP